MDTLEQKLADTHAKHEKELAEIELMARIQTSLIDSIGNNPDKVHPHSAYADAVAEYSADTISDAYLFMERANPIALFRVKDSCLAFKPESAFTRNDESHAELIGPYILRADTMRQYGTKWNLCFFIELDNRVIDVHVSIPSEAMRSDGYTIQYDYKHPSKWHPEGQIESCNIIYPRDYFTRTDRFWATEGQPNNYTLSTL